MQLSLNEVEPSDALRIMKVEIRLIHTHCLCTNVEEKYFNFELEIFE